MIRHMVIKKALASCLLIPACTVGLIIFLILIIPTIIALHFYEEEPIGWD